MRFILSFMPAHFVTYRKQYASFIIMMTLSASLIGLIVFLRSTKKAQLESCEEVITEDSDKVMFVFTDGKERKRVPTGNIEGVKAFGTYHEDMFIIQGEAYEAIRASGGLNKFIELSFAEGGLPEMLETDERYIIVGAGIDDIRVGETITCEDALGNTITGTVYGRLSQGNRWLHSVDAFEGEIGEISVSLDRKFLCFSALDEMPDKSFVIVMEENDREAKQNACEFLEERGINVISAAFLSDIFAISDMENEGIVSLLDEIVWLVIIVSITLMACIQTVIVLNFRRMMGIWYSNGVRRWQAIGVFVAAIVFSTILALGVVWLIAILLINCYANDNRALVWEIIRSRVLGRVMLSVLAMDILGFLLPLHTILSENLSGLLRKFRQ